MPLSRRLLLLFLTLTLGLDAWAAEANVANPANPAASALSVSVSRAQLRPLRETLLVTGTLVAREELLVGAQLDGVRIVDIVHEVGDQVAAGALLARLDRETLDAQLAQTQASLTRADASIAQARSVISEALASQTEADNNLARAQRLRSSGTLSVETLQQHETQAKVAAARVVASREGLNVAEAERAVVHAQLRELEVKLKRSEIRTPHAGLISQRNARLGAVVSSSGEPLFRVVRDGCIELAAEVPESQLPRLSVGQTVTVNPAGSERSLQGTIRLIDPSVNPTTRLGRVLIQLPLDSALRTGSFARGVVDIAQRQAVSVPQSAVLFGAQGAYLQVVNAQGQVEQRVVEIGLKGEGRVEIRNGLTAGEHVITRAGSFVRHGDMVRPQLIED